MSIKDQTWRMPAAYLKVFLQHAAAENLPLSALLKGTGLVLDDLQQSDQPVSLDDTRQVLSNVTRIMGAGWHLSLGPRLTTPSHGPLGFAVVTAPTLGASTDVILRFIGIRGPFLWLTGVQEEDQFVIRLYETTGLGQQRETLIELALLSLQGLLERPLGRELTDARMSFGYAAPAYREKLEQAFHPHLVFNASGHSLRFPAAWLEEPCAMYDEAMHRYLLMRCEEDMRAALGIMPAEISVRQALLSRKGRLPGLTEIAASQHVSPRTLIRRLQQGNTSFQAIRDGLRQSLAVDYLQNSSLNINQIAYRLGYRDPSNVGRAFRKWFGVPPGQFRQGAADAQGK